jgi:hypothetical protein
MMKKNNLYIMGMISLSTLGTKGAESVLQQICVRAGLFATFFDAMKKGGYMLTLTSWWLQSADLVDWSLRILETILGLVLGPLLRAYFIIPELYWMYCVACPSLH